MKIPFVLPFVLAWILPQQIPDFATVLKEQTLAMQRHHSLQYVLESTVEVTSGVLPTSKTMTETSVYQMNPGKSRIETKSRGTPNITMISNGDLLWTYNQATKQYTKTAAALGPGAVANLINKDLPELSNSVMKDATVAGTETVSVDGQRRACWVVKIRLDTTALPSIDNARISDVDMTYCIDKELGINLRSSGSMQLQVISINRQIRTTIESSARSLKIDQPLDDSLFTFVPPVDATEVATLLPPVVQRVDLAGSNAPAFDVRTLDGSSYSLSSLKGRVVLLDFWTSWCGPCRQAMPALETIYQEYKNRGLVVLGIDAGESRQTVDNFLKTTPASYPVALGMESEILAAFKVTTYPTYVLIDANGKIVAYQTGFSGDSTLRNMLAKVASAQFPFMNQVPLGVPNLPVPTASDVFRIGPGVSPPSVLSRVEPQYTDAARSARLQGTVVMEAIINEDGTATIVRVVRSLGYGLDESAVSAISQWKFRPGMRDGMAVKVALNIEVNFNLDFSRSNANGVATATGNAQPLPINDSDPLDSSLRAPTLVAPPADAVFDTFPRLTTVRWDSSPGAVSYLVEWDYSSDGMWQRDRNQRGVGYPVRSLEFTFTFVGAQPGRWRVWPVNAAGQRGTASEWRTFRYSR